MFSALVRRLTRVSRLSLFVAVGLLMAAGVASAGGSHGHGDFEPGADGAGDPYFPLDGNGGYDVKHYFLDVAYDPDTDVLDGVATIEARATQNLSSFNLDFVGLTVESIKVDGRRATWSPGRPGADGHAQGRHPQEPEVHDRRPVQRHPRVPRRRRASSPRTTARSSSGSRMWPRAGSRSTTTRATRPRTPSRSRCRRASRPSPTACSMGKRTKHGRTTWSWEAKEPMASYLATASMGEFEIRAYKENGIRFWDAVDPDLYDAVRAADGQPVRDLAEERAVVQAPPADDRRAGGGATLSFWVNRNTEGNWDFFFVEAHTVGLDDWTTLPDVNGHTSQDTGFVVPVLARAAPVPRALPDRRTTTGRLRSRRARPAHWKAVSGASGGWEQWSVDLSGVRGQRRSRCRSPTRATTSSSCRGAFVDDIVVSTGAGHHLVRERRRHDGRLDGARRAAPAAPRTRTTGSSVRRRTRRRRSACRSTRLFAPPARDHRLRGELLRATTRSRRRAAASSTTSPGSGSRSRTRPGRSTRWTSSSTRVRRRTSSSTSSRTSGTATASPSRSGSTSGSTRASRRTRSGSGTSARASATRAGDLRLPLLRHPRGRPVLAGRHRRSRARPALRRRRLRPRRDDAAAAAGRRRRRRLLQDPPQLGKSKRGGNVTTDQFIRLAERISGQQLDDLFEAWLFTPGRPELPGAAAARSGATALSAVGGASASSGLWRHRPRS